MEEIKPVSFKTEAEGEKEVKGGKKLPFKMIIGVLGLVVLGALTGFGVFQLKNKQSGGVEKLAQEAEGEIKVGDSFGVKDENVFSDKAEGSLVSGGIDGEGSHHLEREGGESQYVYLTSSIVDLDQFVGRKVKVWGQTFEAQKAGWLMDVGRLEILE